MAQPVKVAVFGTKHWVKDHFDVYNKAHNNYELVYYDVTLSPLTAALAKGFQVVCVFVNDTVNAEVIDALAEAGVKLLALRCAGFNNVDLVRAEEKNIQVLRVPTYSPNAVAEHAVALLMALNRKIHKAYNKVREGNFSIDGLLGFDVFGKTVGIIGTGQIGAIFAKILKLGFGAKVIAYDVFQNKELIELGIAYVSLDEIYAQSDIISLHVPLLPATNHMINEESINKMKKGVTILNTSRGALIDTPAVVKALKAGKIGHLGLDVYEEEGNLFYEDLSEQGIADDMLSRLLTFPNVIITGHQAFFTKEAVEKIAQVTLENIADFIAGKPKTANTVTAPTHIAKK
jgi:D-lactate dehydrogenase